MEEKHPLVGIDGALAKARFLSLKPFRRVLLECLARRRGNLTASELADDLRSRLNGIALAAGYRLQTNDRPRDT
jgi:hypothetical protein